ncbi:flagellar protein FlaG [Cytobacillus depressus]|uniref:Flagellar protein FlaG n=1 Tax=Cytobacillus depressus TaxID=1602942 RepID=A0A6L3VC83_9BACI|nr:flagellar protein FlaG [Cytobacillus depressus]KAB2336793.1 flagellar protein FlaG [Cytobacillus depressus]
MGSVDSISRTSVDHISLETNKSLRGRGQQIHNLEQQPENNTNIAIRENDLKQVVTDMNQVLGNSHTSLKYMYHEKLQKYYVTLINDETKETVREIPPKKLLDMYASMKEYLGLFVDNKI